MSRRRVVTLPPGITPQGAVEFARKARLGGAQLLELRTDLHPDSLLAAPLAQQIELLVSARGREISEEWLSSARLVDHELPAIPSKRVLVSHHAKAPMRPLEALSHWRAVACGAAWGIKHVEPLGEPKDAARLFETQRLLRERLSAQHVTVLATGPLALPFRCLLSKLNSLDYVALGSDWAAAPGQRLLADAVRSANHEGGARLGILGSAIAHSRSPRIHKQPFDRIDLPADTQLAPLLAALHAHYKGFAVTSPFKKQVARLIDSPLEAINTLVRSGAGWTGANTDVDGAAKVLARLGEGAVTVLGDGGVTAAIRLAGKRTRHSLKVLRQEEAKGRELGGAVIWTWPSSVAPPEGLRFSKARVAVVAYGAGARKTAAEISARGGVPLLLGAQWFVAQARAQRALWEAG